MVLVILGVIAAITMPTLNLSGNKEKALEVKALKVLGDIDKALDLIIFNDSNGDLLNIYDPYTSGATISIANPNDRDKLKAVLAKYLKITNKPCTSETKCYKGLLNERGKGTVFYLNNGASVGFYMAGGIVTNEYQIPGSDVCNYKVAGVAQILMDVNGTDGPNQNGIDRFKIPLNIKGIDYTCAHCEQSNCAECAPGDPNKCTRCIEYKTSEADGPLRPYKCTLSDGECTSCDFTDVGE